MTLIYLVHVSNDTVAFLMNKYSQWRAGEDLLDLIQPSSTLTPWLLT